MASLSTYRACSPAEALQISQGNHSFARSARRNKTMSWRVGSLNVRSMVDTEGSRQVASQGQRGEDRKIDLIVSELERYSVVVAALQETKWFGNEVYQINGSVVLTSAT